MNLVVCTDTLKLGLTAEDQVDVSEYPAGFKLVNGVV